MAEYIVSKGDNLSSISKKIYGNSNKYMDIARRNGITDVNSLKIGQKLIIDDNINKATANKNNISNNKRQYIVSKGDTLTKIAHDNNTTLNDLVKINNIKDINSILIGQVINIPKRNSYRPKIRTIQEIDALENKYNEDTDENIINNWHKRNNTNRHYIIDDKKNNKLGIYKNGKLIKSYTAIHGKNRESDDMTITYTDNNGKIKNLAGNLSTPAGYYISNRTNDYHGAPAYMRQTQDMRNKNLSAGIPASIHARTITENANTNGCTGVSCNDLKDMANILGDAKDIETYILPADSRNRFKIRNNAIQFKSHDISKTPAYSTIEYNPIHNIKWSTKDLDDHQKQVVNKFATSLKNNKLNIQKELNINDDSYNKLAQAALGILGVESTYGNTNSGIGNFIRASRKAIFKNNSSPDIYSKFHTYGIDDDNNSVGLTQIRYKYLSDEVKELYKKYGITKQDLVDNPDKAAIATIIKLADEYKRVGSIEKAIKGYNNKESYLDMVNNHSKRFTITQKYKMGGDIIRKPNVVRGGTAIPLGRNYYYMAGRKHKNGGIDIGENPRTGLEVEDGEVMHISKDEIKVFSSVPFLNGKSPAQKVLGGENPNAVFKQQELFKDRNGINDDGTKKNTYTKKNTRTKAKMGTIDWNKVDEYADTAEKTLGAANLGLSAATLAVPNPYTAAGAYTTGLAGIGTDIYQGIRSGIKGDWPGVGKNAVDIGLSLIGMRALKAAKKWNDLDKAKQAAGIQREYVTHTIGRRPKTRHKIKVPKERDAAEHNYMFGYGSIPMSTFLNFVDPTKRNNKNNTNDKKAMGGLSRSKDYGSKSKPYPSVKSGDFAGGHRSYPIPTKADAIDALRLAGLHGRSDVRAKVYAKYPDLRKKYKSGGLYSVTVNGETKLKMFPSTGNLSLIRRKAALGTVSDDDNDDWTYTPIPEYKRLYDKFNVKALNKKFDKDYFNLIKQLKDNENLTVADIYNGGENTEDAKIREILGANSTYKDIFDTDKENKLYDYYTTTYPDINVIESRSQNNKTATNNTLKEVVITPKNDEYKTDMSITNNKPFESTTLKEVVVTPEDVKDNTENRIAKNEKRNRLINSYLSGYHGDAINLLSNIGGNIATTLINRRALNKMQAPPQPISQTAAKLKTRININPQLDKMRETLAAYERDVDNNTASSRVALARKQRARFANMLQTNELYSTKENAETELINKDRLNQQEVANSNVKAYNAWQDKVNAFNNAITDKKAENLVGLAQGITSGITSTIGNVQQRIRDDKSILANALSHPNLPIEEFYHNGLISKRAYKAYRKAHPLKTDTNEEN